jgi:hypothetical protein
MGASSDSNNYFSNKNYKINLMPIWKLIVSPKLVLRKS